MRRDNTITALLLSGLVCAACAGADEAGTEGAADTAATPVTTSSNTAPDCFLQGATRAEAAERPSPLRETAFSLGDVDVRLCYGAPSANGRDIMGGLVRYGQLERIGANEPTTIHTTGPINIGGVALAQAGSYSLYAIPNEGEWEFFLNSNTERWGIPIDDAVRATEIASFKATPEPHPEMVETLTFTFEPLAETMGNLVMTWENTRIAIHVMGS